VRSSCTCSLRSRVVVRSQMSTEVKSFENSSHGIQKVPSSTAG